jgi:hypothetical protein
MGRACDVLANFQEVNVQPCSFSDIHFLRFSPQAQVPGHRTGSIKISACCSLAVVTLYLVVSSFHSSDPHN